jgi:hypothetical protein
MNGTSHMIYNNHFFQGDDAPAGVRVAGLVFTQTNVATVVAGNYIDNCFIEWGNEHDPEPAFSNEFSFGGLNVVGNIFIASDVSSAFRWVVVKPYGSGHFLNGFSLVNNTFRVFNAVVDRVEKVDTSVRGAGLHPLAQRPGRGQHLQPGRRDDPEPDRHQPYPEHRGRYLGGRRRHLHPLRRAHPHGGKRDARRRDHQRLECRALRLSERAARPGRRRCRGAPAVGRGGEGQGRRDHPDGRAARAPCCRPAFP